MTKQKRDPRKVKKIHQWAPFQAPWEEETPGFGQFKLDVVTPPEPTEPPDAGSSTDVGIICFRCKRNTYRAIDHRSVEEVLASLPDEKWRRSQGRGDPEAADTILMLICPTCHHGVQMKESVVRRMGVGYEPKRA